MTDEYKPPISFERVRGHWIGLLIGVVVATWQGVSVIVYPRFVPVVPGVLLALVNGFLAYWGWRAIDNFGWRLMRELASALKHRRSGMPPTSPADTASLLVASTLCRIGAIFVGLEAMAMLVPVILEHAKAENPMALLGLLPVFALGLIALAYWLAGYFLGKGRRIGGWIAVLISSVVTVYGVPFEVSFNAADPPLSLPVLNAAFNTLGLAFKALNLAIIGWTVLNWRHLRPASHQADSLSVP